MYEHRAGELERVPGAERRDDDRVPELVVLRGGGVAVDDDLPGPLAHVPVSSFSGPYTPPLTAARLSLAGSMPRPMLWRGDAGRRGR